MHKTIGCIKSAGYGVIRNCFDANEIDMIKQRMQLYLKKHHYGVVYESDGITIRGMHGLHKHDVFFERLIKDARLLNLAEQFLGTKCYLHQFKINFKSPFKGEPWPWHQDFPFWEKRDGILKPNLINIGLIIDDLSLTSGPLCIIPKSHLSGNLSQKVNDGKSWKNDVSTNLTYQVDNDILKELLVNNEVQFITGKAGDIFLFDPMVVHASGTNLSFCERRLLILIYNSLDNLPVKSNNKSPSFLTSSDYAPLFGVDTSLDCYN